MRIIRRFGIIQKLTGINRYIFEASISNADVANQAMNGARADLKQKMLACCTDIWEAVKATLCYDSPEGYEDEAEAVDGLDIGLKDTLSFCWRAVKESRSDLLPYRDIQCHMGLTVR